jgi:hypothetical protein
MTKLFTSNLAKSTATVDEETVQEMRAAYRATSWVRYVVRPLFMATLVLAIMVGLLVVIRTVTLDERWSKLTVLFFFIILEAIYTTNWIKHPDRLRLDRSTYRAAELLLILIIVRLASWYIFDGVIPDVAQLTFYLVNPLRLFLNGQFLVTLLLAMIAWRLANLLADIFMQLEISEFELRYYSLPPAQRKARSDDKPIMAGRHYMVLRFTQYWLWGGILLAFTIGLSTLEISSLNTLKNPLAIGRLGLQPELLMVLLLYFGIGFYLLSQAKLMEMNARWLLNDITKDEQMQKTWQRFSLIILLLIGLIAAFLPIGPNLAIGHIIAAVMYVIFLIMNLLIFILSLPLLLLYALFSGRPVEDVPPQPPLSLEALQEAVPPEVSSLSETLAMVLSSAFWSVFIIGVVLALLFFLRERKGILQNASVDQIWPRFWDWLKNLWWIFSRRVENVRWQLPKLFAVKEVESQPNDGQGSIWRFFRLGALAPREQIRYFYLSTVRRAGEKGVKREAAETPLEYVEDLKDGWPTVEEEVEELTDAFLKARYSDEPITPEDIPEIKESWMDVRRQLKKRSQPDDDEAQD